MSEMTPELVEAEAGPEGEGEAQEGYPSEALEAAESYPGEWYDADRDARLRRMVRARQQAQTAQMRRRPAPARPPAPAPQRMARFTGPSASQIRDVQTDVLSLDLDTKAALNRIRRELDAANRDTYRNAWVTEAAAASALILNSFPEALENYDWARALIIGAPTLITATGRRGKLTAERIVTDPRFADGLGLALIWGVSHFTKESRQSRRVNAIQLRGPASALAVGDTPTLYAVAFDARGNQVPNVPITFASDTPASVTVDPNTGQLNAVARGTARITASHDGISDVIYVTVS